MLWISTTVHWPKIFPDQFFMASAPSERMVEHALALIVQSEIAPDPAAVNARASLIEWRERSSSHDAAAREAHTRWNMLGGMSADLREHYQETASIAGSGVRTSKERQRRKLLLSVAGLLGTGAILGRGAYWFWQQPINRKAYETRIAQMLRVTLADGTRQLNGSRVELAPLSAIDVSLFRHRRSVTLTRGELRFSVAPDATRPFEVLTRDVRIEVIGTVFTVRDRGSSVTVGVEQGHVKVVVLAKGTDRRDAPAHTTFDLFPGQILDLREGQSAVMREADVTTLSAWLDGWLVFENTPMREALITINAYRDRPIEAGDERVAAMRLTGRFRANDSAALLAALPSILPLTVRTLADGSVLLNKV